MKNFSFIQSKFVFLFCLVTFCMFNSSDVFGESRERNLELTSLSTPDTDKELSKRNLSLKDVKQCIVKKYWPPIVLTPWLFITIDSEIAHPPSDVINKLQRVASRYEINQHQKEANGLTIRLENTLSKPDQQEIEHILSHLDPKYYKLSFSSASRND